MVGGARSMAGYMGGPTARIRMNGTGYANKALHKPMQPKPMLKKPVIPPSLRSLNSHTMNKVFNHRLGKNPITQDTLLSKLI